MADMEGEEAKKLEENQDLNVVDDGVKSNKTKLSVYGGHATITAVASVYSYICGFVYCHFYFANLFKCLI